MTSHRSERDVGSRDAAQRLFQPGFRISRLDVAVLVVGAAAATGIALAAPWIGLAIGFVVAHFFLFCNVVRMARPFELTWAGVFVALAVGAQVWGVPNWSGALAASLAATLVLVVLTLRKPSYHGAFWQRINPELPVWWEANRPAMTEAAALDEEALHDTSAKSWAVAAGALFLATLAIWGYSCFAMSVYASRPSPGTFGPILQPLIRLACACVSLLGGLVELGLLIKMRIDWRRGRLSEANARVAFALAVCLLAIATGEIVWLRVGPDL